MILIVGSTGLVGNEICTQLAAQKIPFRALVRKDSATEKGFVPQKGRWQVERSFAWENFYRRLSKDYEKTVDSSVAFIQLAFISIILSKF